MWASPGAKLSGTKASAIAAPSSARHPSSRSAEPHRSCRRRRTAQLLEDSDQRQPRAGMSSLTAIVRQADRPMGRSAPMTEQANQPMATLLAGPHIGKHFTTRISLAHRVIQSAIGSNPASEVIAEPRNCSSKQQSNSSRRAPLSASHLASPSPARSYPCNRLNSNQVRATDRKVAPRSGNRVNYAQSILALFNCSWLVAVHA